MLTSLLLGLAWVASAFAARGTYSQITNYGSNPTGVSMYLYRPPALANPPPLIVAMHYCTGTAQAYYTGTPYADLADSHGFLVIYPNAPDSGGCWDVHTNATLTHNAGGDSLAIASAVRYAISSLGVDASRVFATGTSSGAMMTNVLMGAYPDLFKAGVAFSGVPYGCFAGASMWNSQCAQGQLTKTAQQWGDQVRAGYPGYTGTRPRFQFWHGTADTTLYPQNFYEGVKQWTNVLGVSATPTSNVTGSPSSQYSRASFGANLQAILGQGVGHSVPVFGDEVLAWFGLSSLQPGQGGGTTAGPGTTTAPVTTAVPTTTAPTAPGGTAAHWAQCGGSGWTGPTQCESPYKCTALNSFYSQCL